MRNKIPDETYESVGIQNCGNSCYMNSAIQLLLSIKEFREYILNQKDNKNNTVISNLKSIFQAVEDCRRKKCSVVLRKKIRKDYEELFKKFPLKGVNFGSQGDSQEFLSFLIDNLGIGNQPLLDIMFFGYQTKTYCRKKGTYNLNNLENVEDYMGIFQVHIHEGDKKKSIKELLEEEIKNPELLNKHESLDKCKSLGLNSYKENDILLDKKHKYFLVQILRFTYSKELNGIKFLESNVEINKYLEINGHTYVLSGIILRRGGNNSGHYIYASFKNGELFLIYDDESVYNKIDYGFDIEKHSYVIYYKRKENENLERPVQEKIRLDKEKQE